MDSNVRYAIGIVTVMMARACSSALSTRSHLSTSGEKSKSWCWYDDGPLFAARPE
jgi:hypothetical protein